MSPLGQAEEYYGEFFAEHLTAFLHTGVVISTDRVFLLGRPVPTAGDPREIWDPWVHYDPAECDAWYVHFGAGDLKEIIKATPYPMPWLFFSRSGGPVKKYNFDRLSRRIK